MPHDRPLGDWWHAVDRPPQFRHGWRAQTAHSRRVDERRHAAGFQQDRRRKQGAGATEGQIEVVARLAGLSDKRIERLLLGVGIPHGPADQRLHRVDAAAAVKGADESSAACVETQLGTGEGALVAGLPCRPDHPLVGHGQQLGIGSQDADAAKGSGETSGTLDHGARRRRRQALFEPVTPGSGPRYDLLQHKFERLDRPGHAGSGRPRRPWQRGHALTEFTDGGEAVVRILGQRRTQQAFQRRPGRTTVTGERQRGGIDALPQHLLLVDREVGVVRPGDQAVDAVNDADVVEVCDASTTSRHRQCSAASDLPARLSALAVVAMDTPSHPPMSVPGIGRRWAPAG